MSTGQGSQPAVACPPTGDALAQQIHQRLDEIIAFCRHQPGPTSFLDFEAALLGLLRSLGCLLIALFLQARHDRLDLTPWTHTRGYRVADPPPSGRSRPVAGRSPTTGPSSCPVTVVVPACTRWMSSWA